MRGIGAFGGGGARTWPSGPGAPCGRTTATDGDAWDYFPHDHARSRAYRWNEDGLAGICDDRQALCFAPGACGTAQDPILKERMFGLTGAEGNHGEDVKEYWWYLDATPTPLLAARGATTTRSAGFPYERAGRGRTAPRRASSPSYELVDTGRLRRRPLLVDRPSTTPRPTPTDMCVRDLA